MRLPFVSLNVFTFCLNLSPGLQELSPLWSLIANTYLL